MKIQIIGYSGSGKSTFAKKISNHYSLPLLYIDTVAFYPNSNWELLPIDERTNNVSKFMNQKSWVIDGNYSTTCIERFDECDLLLFFNFNRFKCFFRALKRKRKYKNTPRESSPGCPETFDLDFVMWILFKGRDKKHREFYKNSIKKHKDKSIIFKSQRQINKYLLSIGFTGSLKYE